MEQLWYTSCRNGLGSGGGNMVRAASRGLTDLRSERNQRLSRYLRYSLPSGAQPHTASPASAPRNLALLETGQERILLHQAYVGLDYTGMRYGNHFSHLLVDVPQAVSARQAIELWESDFWQTREPEEMAGKYDLPLVEPADLRPGPLSYPRWDTTRAGYLAWLIEAYLTLPADGRICIMGPTEIIAALIWGLTHALPEQLTAGLTFATYTDDVANSPARIVGTTAQGEERDRADLPAPGPRVPTRNLNLFNGRAWSAGESNPFSAWSRAYAAYAAAHLGTPDLQLLLDLAAERPGWAASHFLEAFSVFRAALTDAAPDYDMLQRLLEEPDYAARLLSRPAVQRALIHACAEGDPDAAGAQWWAQRGKDAFARLYRAAGGSPQLSAALQSTAATATSLCARVIENGDVAGAERLYRKLLVPLSDDNSRFAWDALLPQIRPDRTRQPAARAWVLRQSAAVRVVGSAAALEEAVAPWLQVDRQTLEQVLPDRFIPPAWKIQALQAVLMQPELADADLAELASAASLELGEALANLANAPETLPLAMARFDALVRLGAPGKLPILRRLLRAIPKGPDAPAHRRELIRQMPLLPAEIIQLVDEDAALGQDADLARSLADDYLRQTGGNWLSWLDMLGNPYLAAELLGRVDARNRMLDGIFEDKAAFMRAGHRHLPTLLLKEPQQLSVTVANLVEACLARIAYALEDRRFESAAFVFDDVVLQLAARPADALAFVLRAAQPVIPAADDSDTAWQFRAQIFRWLKETRARVQPAEGGDIDQLAQPFLTVTPYGLIRLAEQLFSLSRPLPAEAGQLGPEDEHVNVWLSVAEREAPPPAWPSFQGSRAPQTPAGPPFTLGPEERGKVARHADRYQRRFATALARQRYEAAAAYFTALIQADPARTAALMREALTSEKVETTFLNRLVSIGLNRAETDEQSGSDLQFFESLVRGDERGELLRKLAISKSFQETARRYLKRVRVENCGTEPARATVERLTAAQPGGAIATEANFWLTVADLKAGNQGKFAAVLTPLPRMADEKEIDPARLESVIDLLLQSVAEPKELGALLNSPVVARLARSGRSSQPGGPLPAFEFALMRNPPPTVVEDARRLAPFVLLALKDGGQYSDRQYLDMQSRIAEYLGKSDPALIQTLDRELRGRFGKKSYLEEGWKQLKSEVMRQQGGARVTIKNIFGGLGGKPGGPAHAQPNPQAARAKNERRTFIIHRATEDTAAADAILELWQSPTTGAALGVFDLTGRPLSVAQPGDLVAVRIAAFANLPGSTLPTDGALFDVLNSEYRATGKWSSKRLSGSLLGFLPGVVQTLGPSYARYPEDKAAFAPQADAPWMQDDILLIRWKED